MKHYNVIRSYLEKATVGFVDLEDTRLQTLERPWLNNKVGESCIPEGTYLVKRDVLGRWQYYSITNVPNRTFIEIHPANYVEQVKGCLAKGVSRMKDNISINHSERAVEMFKAEVGDEDFLITFRAFNPNFDSLTR